MTPTISSHTADILAHTARTGRYVTDEPHVIALAKAGLLHDHGAQRLAGGMHYFTMTGAGRDALTSWAASQPMPPKAKVKRRSAQFQAWRDYREAFRPIPFSEFIKKIWPSHHQMYPGWMNRKGEN